MWNKVSAFTVNVSEPISTKFMHATCKIYGCSCRLFYRILLKTSFRVVDKYMSDCFMQHVQVHQHFFEIFYNFYMTLAGGSANLFFSFLTISVPSQFAYKNYYNDQMATFAKAKLDFLTDALESLRNLSSFSFQLANLMSVKVLLLGWHSRASFHPVSKRFIHGKYEKIGCFIKPIVFVLWKMGINA